MSRNGTNRLVKMAEALAVACGAPSAKTQDERIDRGQKLGCALEILDRADFGISDHEREAALGSFEALTERGAETEQALLEAYLAPLPKLDSGDVSPRSPGDASAPAPSSRIVSQRPLSPEERASMGVPPSVKSGADPSRQVLGDVGAVAMVDQAVEQARAERRPS